MQLLANLHHGQALQNLHIPVPQDPPIHLILPALHIPQYLTHLPDTKAFLNNLAHNTDTFLLLARRKRNNLMQYILTFLV